VPSHQSINSKLQASSNCLRLNMLAALPPIALLASVLWATPAHALDGCRVMLCLAAPKWREVPLCVPTINDLMKHLAKGRPFPICTGGGSDNIANNEWANAPGNCPVQYIYEVDGANGPQLRCKYSGAVTVNIKNVLWSRTWWTFTGESVTEFSPEAKAQLGTWDSKFDDDYAAWLAAQVPPAP
jgi:hypothetical protein